MITEQALDEAIAECKGERNPNANTCVKLAAYYQIKDKLYPSKQTGSVEPVERGGYSYATAPMQEDGSEFSRIIRIRSLEDTLPVLDELMETIKILNPRLHDAVMRKLKMLNS